jgi:hypothetical protein
MDLHLCGRCLQSGADAESADSRASFRKRLASSVSRRLKSGFWTPPTPENLPPPNHDTISANSYGPFFRILLERSCQSRSKLATSPDLVGSPLNNGVAQNRNGEVGMFSALPAGYLPYA